MADDRPRRHELPLLDGLRGVAALMVVATHVAFQTGTVDRGPFGAVLARFDFGVALFFVAVRLPAGPALAGGGRVGGRPAEHACVPACAGQRGSCRRTGSSWSAPAHDRAWDVGSGVGLANAALLQVYTGQLLDGLTQTW